MGQPPTSRCKLVISGRTLVGWRQETESHKKARLILVQLKTVAKLNPGLLALSLVHVCACLGEC